MAAITIIEDDQRIRELLARTLADRGHVVETHASGMDGLQGVIAARPDLVILDLGLPDIDGQELLKMIRATSEIPVIVATARSEDSEIVTALDAGADDYLVKPFSTDQIEARVRAVLRRSEARASSGPLRVGELVVDVRGRSAQLGERTLDLTPKEFDLLACLAERAGEVVSKRELMAEVWREPFGGSEKTVDVHLSWLRKKLGEKASEPRYVHAIFGVGVKLMAPDE
jgi:DNA-binding response OmpR family regulator